MSFLNVNASILCYQDGPASNSPLLRQADLKWSLMGLLTDKVRQVPVNLAPGESMVVASTARPLTLSGAASVSVVSGKMRLACSLGQRTGRSDGDATTEWSVTKMGEVTRFKAVGGTMPVFGGILPGDQISVEAPFQATNHGVFTILSVGSDYVEFINPVSFAESVTGQVHIFTSGPVQAGDTLDISSSLFAYPNRGSFPITKVTDSYIEVINPNAYPETLGSISDGISIYPYYYNWMLIAVDRKAMVGLNGGSTAHIEVAPPVAGDIVKSPGLFLKRGKVFQVQISNPGLDPVQGFMLLAE